MQRTVKSFNSGTIVLINPLPFIPAIGDTFNLTLGCQHTISDCIGKFNNLANYGGEPFIPSPETQLYGGNISPSSTTTSGGK